MLLLGSSGTACPSRPADTRPARPQVVASSSLPEKQGTRSGPSVRSHKPSAARPRRPSRPPHRITGAPQLSGNPGLGLLILRHPFSVLSSFQGVWVELRPPPEFPWRSPSPPRVGGDSVVSSGPGLGDGCPGTEAPCRVLPPSAVRMRQARNLVLTRAQSRWHQISDSSPQNPVE